MEVDWQIPMTPLLADCSVACAGWADLRTTEEDRRKVTDLRMVSDTNESHQSIVSTTLFLLRTQIATWLHARRHGGWRHSMWHGAMSSLIIAQKFWVGEAPRCDGRSSLEGGGLANASGTIDRRPIRAVTRTGPFADC